MDTNTSNFVVAIITTVFSFFTTIYTSAKSRKINCCGVVNTDTVMKESK